MDRLQKKCAIASTGFHLLLLLILMIGPAFFTSSSRVVPEMQVLDFVPVKTVDEMMSGGGNPKAQPPAASQQPPAQPQPQPQPPPPKPQPQPKVKEPDPEPAPPKDSPKETVKKPAPDSDSLEVSDKPKQFNFVAVKSNNAAKQSKDRQAKAEREAREYAEARKRLADQFRKSEEALGNGLSSGTSVELKGPGGGGVPYANFLQAVMSRYDSAWFLPEGVTDSDASALVSVTIARDGKVISAQITRRSGNREVDRSVQAAIDRVRIAAPLPDNAKESQRTVEINFNVRAKRAIG